MCFQNHLKEIPHVNILKNTPIKWNTKEDCIIQYSLGKKQIKIPGKIKCRGGMSSKYYKHSYTLELSNKHAFAPLRKDDDWIINANFIDKTFMRHKVSYDLFREMNPNNKASKCAYINVSKNNKYNGLYVLMEKINASMLNLNKKDSLAMLFKDPPIFYNEPLSYVQDTTNYYQQKYPNIKHRDKSSYIEKFKHFLYTSSDEQFCKEINNWVDVNNVIDWHLIILFSNNGDGILKNFYLYKIDDKTPFRFAIWDYDHSYGRDGDYTLNMMKNEANWKKAILLNRLFSIDKTNYKKRLKERWNQLRETNIFSKENLYTHIHENHQLIKNEINSNTERWSNENHWYSDSNSYDDEINLMKKFIEKRIQQLDLFFQNL